MILFIYITRIASNEKFKFSILIIFLLIIRNFRFIIINTEKFLLNRLIKNDEIIYLTYNFNNSISLIKFINYPNNIILLIVFLYLFITLIAVTKICDKSKGPLRQKF